MWCKFEHDEGDYGEVAEATIVEERSLFAKRAWPDEPTTLFTLSYGRSQWFDGVSVTIVVRSGSEDEFGIELLRLTDRELRDAVTGALPPDAEVAHGESQD